MAAAMHRTFTPELDTGTLRRLEEDAAHFAEDFNRPRQRAWCAVDLAGLLQDGERKRLEPSIRRVRFPRFGGQAECRAYRKNRLYAQDASDL